MLTPFVTAKPPEYFALYQHITKKHDQTTNFAISFCVHRLSPRLPHASGFSHDSEILFVISPQTWLSTATIETEYSHFKYFFHFFLASQCLIPVRKVPTKFTRQSQLQDHFVSASVKNPSLFCGHWRWSVVKSKHLCMQYVDEDEPLPFIEAFVDGYSEHGQLPGATWRCLFPRFSPAHS